MLELNITEMVCACESAKPHIELALSYLKELVPNFEDNIIPIDFPSEYIDAVESLKEAAEYLDAFIENYREEQK